MKKIFIICVGFFLICLAVPFSALAQDKWPWDSDLLDAQWYYITAKPGIYVPHGDLKDFDIGFNGEIASGMHYNKNFAAEINLGYFHTGIKEKTSGTINGLNFFGEEKVSINVLPVTFTLKGIIPYQRWEFFGLGGVGAYFVWVKDKINVTIDGLSSSASANGNDTLFGGYLGGGIHYNLTRQIFVGAEGKYLWTNDADIDGMKFNLNGIIVSGVIGFRF